MNLDLPHAQIDDAMQSAQRALDATLNRVTGEIIRGQREVRTRDVLADCIFALIGAIGYLQAAQHALHLKKEADRDLAARSSDRHS